MSTDARYTFTLRDLCVVIAVFCLLFAVLLPKLAQKPVSGRRITCANNMDQIALALQNYVTTKGFFPGYRGNRVPDNNGFDADNIDVSWFVAVAPQMEQGVIYDRWDQLTAQVPPPAGAHNYPFIEFVVCPSNSAARTQPANNQPVSHLSYVANAGASDPTPARPIDRNVAPDHKANGVFHDLLHPLAPKLSLEMKDGASNTLLLSENNQARYWSDQDEFRIAFVFHPISTPGTTGKEANYRINAGRKISDDDADLSTARPSSNHPGGVMVTFCDGRTIFLREDIDYKVYQQLMTPDGYHPKCDVPSTDEQGQPVPGSNKAHVLRSDDYATQKWALPPP
jgi:prepilin-type processing-associated H-X9-DG protein